MKLRVHYKHGYGKTKIKDFPNVDEAEFQEAVEAAAEAKKSRGLVIYDFRWAVPAEEIILMELVP
jgi:hypothetical protein